MMSFWKGICLLLSVVTLCSGPSAAQTRVRDLVDVEGVRTNDLVGYGLVVGLNGTGDALRNSPYTEEALQLLLERLGVNVQGEEFRSRNIAAVLVTASLPPFARAGSSIDIQISTIGDASSLLGGTLIMTPLRAADGQIYAVAQGSILVSGINADGNAASVTSGVPTVASMPGGAKVEREVAFNFNDMDRIRLNLRAPDFTTASRISEVINARFTPETATLLDPGTVDLSLKTTDLAPASFMVLVENLTVAPAQKARVVIDQRSGTIVLGSDVKLSAVAVAQGNLSIRITETPVVSQPNPFSPNGESIVLPRTDIEIDEGSQNRIAVVDQSISLSELVSNLNELGVGPRDMIDILKSIKAAGALHAELIVN